MAINIPDMFLNSRIQVDQDEIETMEKKNDIARF